MPWKIYKDGSQYCIHKKKSDGSKGAKKGCHSTKAEAKEQLQALNASEDKEMNLKEFLVKNAEDKEGFKSLLEKSAEKDESVKEYLEKEDFTKEDVEQFSKHLAESEDEPVSDLSKNLEEMLEKTAFYSDGSPIGETFYVPTIGAETFSDLDEQREIETKMNAFREDSEDFINLFENIVYSGDMKFAEKGSKVVTLANDYADRIEKNFNQESEDKEIDEKEGVIEKLAGRVVELLSGKKEKQSQENLMLYKDNDGNLRWIARYSNNFRDDEKEIIAEKSHERFVDLVDKGLAPYPELVIWHEKDWNIGKADWLAYDDSGYALASGLVDKEAIEVAVWLSKQKDIRTSHGMPRSTIKRDEKDPSVIVEHETREISILPKDRAANKLTGWYTIEKELQEDNMISDEKKEKLTKEWGIENSVLEGLEHLNKAEAEAAEQLGIDRKDIDVDEEDPKDEDAQEEKETQEEEVEEETFATKKEVADVLSVVVKQLSERIEKGFEEVNEKVDAVNSNVEKEVNKKLSETPTASIAGMVSKKLSVTNSEGEGLEDVEVDGRTKLAKDKPKEEETKVKERTGVPFIDEMISQEGAK